MCRLAFSSAGKLHSSSRRYGSAVMINLTILRQVLVNLLGIPERSDWKACMLSEEEDRADARDFKAAFAPFDMTT